MFGSTVASGAGHRFGRERRFSLNAADGAPANRGLIGYSARPTSYGKRSRAALATALQTIPARPQCETAPRASDGKHSVTDESGPRGFRAVE